MFLAEKTFYNRWIYWIILTVTPYYLSREIYFLSKTIRNENNKVKLKLLKTYPNANLY